MEETKQEPKRSLVKKLAEVMGEIEYVPKLGTNEGQGYKYATEASIAAAVRAGLARRSIIMMPSVVKTDWSSITTRSGGTLRLCTLTVRFTLEDGDTGETREIVVMGEGTDPGDKATYKAMTGAEKYALLKLFLIPTGDDPEAKDDVRAEDVAPPKRQRPPPSDDAYGESLQQSAPPSDEQGQTWTGKLSSAQSAPDPEVKYGSCKGNLVSELEGKNLGWYLKTARENVAKRDPKWGRANQAFLDALEAHAKRTGHVSEY